MSVAPFPTNLAPLKAVPPNPLAASLATILGAFLEINLPIPLATAFVAAEPIKFVPKNCVDISADISAICPAVYQPLTSSFLIYATSVFVANASIKSFSLSVRFFPPKYLSVTPFIVADFARPLSPKEKKLSASAASFAPAHILLAQLPPFFGAFNSFSVSSTNFSVAAGTLIARSAAVVDT